MYEPSNSHVNVASNKPVKQDYSGPKDEKTGMSEGRGSIIYNRDDVQCSQQTTHSTVQFSRQSLFQYMQSYEGNFLWNNVHGEGEYRWEPPKCGYEGQLYANKREGYGRFSYPSGACFEGLYLNDRRFGPGVYTDAAGYQDVGIWVASKLVRLSRVVEPNVPRLASRDEDKIKILRYRRMICLNKEKPKYVAENLLESLTHSRNYDRTVLARAEELYNQLCRDERALSFNKPRYDEAFFGNENDELTIDVLMTEKEIQRKIAAEEEAAIEIKDTPSDAVVNEKSKIISEPYSPEDNLYNNKISRRNESAADNNKEEREEDADDYCGINNIDPMDMGKRLFNHEEQWYIFKSSTVTVLQDAPKDCDLKEENLGDSTETLIEEFDNFGRRRVKDVNPTKKVVVTHLMAWNNSPILIELLKHVFKHRKFEKKLSFDISKVLGGRRGSFRQEGTHEKAALELLEACSSGSEYEIFKLISSQNLDVDVADSRGNTGLFLAAASDRLKVIDTLLNLGADVDSINDECLTPLSMCILRLLDIVHDVTNWSEAFLPKKIFSELLADDEPGVFKNSEQWHGRVSLESLVQQLPKRMDWNPSAITTDLQFNSEDLITEGQPQIHAHSKVTKSKQQMEQEVTHKLKRNPDTRNNNDTNGLKTQKYIFDLAPIIGNVDYRNKFKSHKTKNKKRKDGNISMKSKDLLNVSKQMRGSISNEVSEKTEKICATISKLLERGADPNFAQVPYPVVVMAIFTKVSSLVSELLKHGANPNTTLDKADHYFTPLLILALLPPASEHSLMAQALLMAKADPSKRVDPEYRPDLMERFKLNRISQFLDDSEGMTALHLLAIRTDMQADSNEYLGELIRVIYQHGCIKSSDLYQGHSPLSLSIFEGNLTAAKAFLKTHCVNVNEQLGPDLGNAMLMLVSCVLQKLLPPDLLHEFLELVLEYGGCPFASVQVLNEEHNQIEYGRKELSNLSNPSEKTVEEVKEKRKKNKLKRSKSSKTTNILNFAKTVEFIEKKAKQKLIEKVKANFVEDLMECLTTLLSTEKQSQLLHNPIFENAMTWMTGEDVAVVMRTMSYNRTHTRELVRLFVTACILRQKNSSPEVDALIRDETERIINEVMPLVDKKNQISKVSDFGSEGTVSNGATKLDQVYLCKTQSNVDDNRFKVCFECLEVHGKVLIPCPTCKRIYFCSTECNEKSSTHEDNLHQCPIFYQKERARLERIDPFNYVSGRLTNPELRQEDEKNSGLYDERKGTRSVQNQDRFVSTPKCKDLDFTVKKSGVDNSGDKSEDRNKYKDDITHEDNRDKRSHKKDKTSDTEDEEAAANSKKSNEEKIDKNKDHSIKSKNVGKKDQKINDEVNENGASSDIKSKKSNKNRYGSNINEDGGNNERENASNNKKLKKGLKNGHRGTVDEGRTNNERDDSNNIKSRRGIKTKDKVTMNKVEGNSENKTKQSTVEKNYALDQNRGYGIKIKNGKKQGSEFDHKNGHDDSKVETVENNRLKGTKSDKPINSFHKTNNNKGKHSPDGKHEVRGNKQEGKNGFNEKVTKRDSHSPDKSRKNRKSVVETRVPEKYLDWLLKVSRSAGENMNIDMLMLPYVVFAQGDTYFSLTKFTENYSLI